VAFIRRRGNAFYLVHNVRRRGKVKQLHLARLGERPRITDDVVRAVSKSYPLLDLDWARLREQANGRVELFDLTSEDTQKLLASIRRLNLDLADLTPPLVEQPRAPLTASELVTHLRLLRSTVDVKLDQLERRRDLALLAGRRVR